MIALFFLIPVVACLAIGLTPKSNEGLMHAIARVSIAATALLSVYVLLIYDSTLGGVQFLNIHPWIPALNIRYSSGVDGISVMMILLNSLVSVAAVWVSKEAIHTRLKEYYIFLLLLIASIYGVFTTFDLFFMYFFYEMAVMPMFLLISIWGSGNKEYATMKLTLMITGGAVLALLAIMVLTQTSGASTFDWNTLVSFLQSHPLPRSTQIFAAFLLLVGFGVISSLFPFHSWSPIGYAAAPIPVSMIHAGVLKKLGPYLLLRLALPLLPEGCTFWMPIIATLCVVNIIYAGYCAMTAKDLKYIIGFSSVSHMGYVLLGIATLTQLGLSGTVLLIFSHGVMAALAFALIGHVYHQTHTRMVPELGGGLASQVPFTGLLFVMTAMASAGLPGFSNFAAEVMILFSAWDAYPWFTVAAVFGVLVTAVYLLRAVRSVFFGPVTQKWPNLKDILGFTSRFPYLLLISALLLFGFFPNLFLRSVSQDVKTLASFYEKPSQILAVEHP